MARAEAPRGRLAPISYRGWRDVLVRVKDEVSQQSVSVIAAGVAFYAMLALFPALAAFISIYGLLVDPSQVQVQLERSSGLPPQVRGILGTFLASLSGDAQGALGLGLIGGLLLALWSASRGVKALMGALNLAYQEEEDRSFLRLNARALLLTAAAIAASALAAIVVGPLIFVVRQIAAAPWVAAVVPWLVVLPLFVVGLSALYRWGPSRASVGWRWVTPGSLLATLLWALGSIGLSLYAVHFGNYERTYGALGGVVVLLLWLWLLAYAVIVGAELNAQLERHVRTAPEPEP